MHVDPKFVEDTYAAKERRRRALAELPIEVKIEHLVELQKRARTIATATGRKAPFVWKLPSESSTSS